MPAADQQTAGWVSIREHARLVGGHVWLAERGFELLGAWAPGHPEHAERVRLAVRSRHLADHAAILRGLLPVVGDVDPTLPIVAPDAAVEDLVERLRGTPATVEAVAEAEAALVDRLRSEAAAHLVRCSNATDGATKRALRTLLHDLG